MGIGKGLYKPLRPANRKLRVGLGGLFVLGLVLAGLGSSGTGLGVVPAPKVKLVDTFQTVTRSEAGSLVHPPSNSNMIYGCINSGYCGSDPGTAFLTTDNTTGGPLQTYCLDFNLIINYGRNAYQDDGRLFGTPDTAANPQGNANNPSQIAYIVTHYAPANNHFPEPFGDVVEEAAVQAALWHYSQGFYFSTAGGGATSGTIITRYNQIIEETSHHAGYVQPGIVGIDPNPNPAVSGVDVTPVPTINIPNDITPGQSNFNVYYANAMHGEAQATGGGTDFSSIIGLQLNGNASQNGNQLQLTPNVQGAAGSAWSTTKLDLTKNFTSSFEFELYSGTQADGITFALQASPQGKNALGTGGQDLGFWGITPAAGVEFDTFTNGGCDINNNHMAFVVDTTTCDGGLYTPPFSIWNAGPVPTYATISYNASTHILSAGVSQSASAPANIFETINLASTVGNTAYVGFTGSTGGNNEFNDILNWTVNGVGYTGFGNNTGGSHAPGAMSGRVQVSLDNLGTSDAHFCPNSFSDGTALRGTGNSVTKIEVPITGVRQVSVCATTTNDAAPVVNNAASTQVTMHAALCGSDGTTCADASVKDRLTEGYEMVSGSPGQYQRLVNGEMVPINTEPDPITGLSHITVIGHIVPSSSQTVTDNSTTPPITMTATVDQLTALAVHPGDSVTYTINYVNQGSEDAPAGSTIITDDSSTTLSDNMGLLSGLSKSAPGPNLSPEAQWPIGAVSHANGGSVSLTGTVPSDLPTGTLNQPSPLICNRPNWIGSGLDTSAPPVACVEVVPKLNVTLTQTVSDNGSSAPTSPPSCSDQANISSVSGQVNDWATYCITLSNESDTPISGVSVYDPLPITGGLIYNSILSTPGNNPEPVFPVGAASSGPVIKTSADGQERIEWNNLDLPSGSSITTEVTGQLSASSSGNINGCSPNSIDANTSILWAPGILLLDSNQTTVSITSPTNSDSITLDFKPTPNPVHLNEQFSYTAKITNTSITPDGITNLFLIYQPPADLQGQAFTLQGIDIAGIPVTPDTVDSIPGAGHYTVNSSNGSEPPIYTIALEVSPNEVLGQGLSTSVVIQMFPPSGAPPNSSAEPLQLRVNSSRFGDSEGDPISVPASDCGIALIGGINPLSGNPGNVRLER